MLDTYGNCPECGVCWDAGSIFDTLRSQQWCAHMADAELQDYVNHAYGTDRPQRFSRLIGVSSLEHDRVIAWKCPDCNHEWSRT
jgi:hypothetical protein